MRANSTRPPRSTTNPCEWCGRLCVAWPWLRHDRRFCSKRCYFAWRRSPDRFWATVDQSAGPTGCWPWRGGRRTDGYGKVQVYGHVYLTHRYAFFLTHARWPLECRHTCDNRPCCNPAHLLDGTHADNNRDMVERGRYATEERHGSAKVTREQAEEIRRRYAAGGITQRSLGLEYGLTQSPIHKIITRVTWGSPGPMPEDDASTQ